MVCVKHALAEASARVGAVECGRGGLRRRIVPSPGNRVLSRLIVHVLKSARGARGISGPAGRLFLRRGLHCRLWQIRCVLLRGRTAVINGLIRGVAIILGCLGHSRSRFNSKPLWVWLALLVKILDEGVVDKSVVVAVTVTFGVGGDREAGELGRKLYL